MDVVGDVHHLFFFHAACGDGGGAYADAAAFADRLGVEGDAVFVYGDSGVVEDGAGECAVEAFGAKVHEHEVVVCPAADDAVAVVGEAGAEGFGVVHDLLGVGFE